jgi:hypothetical protein
VYDRRLDDGPRGMGRRPYVGERDAERGQRGREAIRHGQRDEAAVDREGVDGQLRSQDVLLDEDGAHPRLRSGLRKGRREPIARIDERQPTLSLPVWRLHDAWEREARLARVERPRVRDTGRSERVALAHLRGRECAGAGVDRMGQPEPPGDPGGDADRPVRARRDDPVDTPRAREPADRLLVLGRQHRAFVGEPEARRSRIAVDGNHIQVPARPGGLEQAELSGPCA